MRFYHFLKEEYALKSLINRRLKLCRIDHANDPFEFLGVKTNSIQEYESFKNLKSELSKSKGMICVSEFQQPQFKESLLWAHYGDGHKGICLEIEISDEWVTQSDHSRKVTYLDEKLECPAWLLDGSHSWTADESKKIKAEDFITSMITTKSKDWEYEQERRLFFELKIEENGIYYADFSCNFMLKNLIVGCRSTLASNELKNHLRDFPSEINIWKTEMDPKYFSLNKLPLGI